MPKLGGSIGGKKEKSMQYRYHVALTYENKDYGAIFNVEELIESKNKMKCLSLAEVFVRDFAERSQVNKLKIEEIRVFRLDPFNDDKEGGNEQFVMELLYAAKDFKEFESDIANPI